MTSIPRTKTFDSSLAFLSDGYTFIQKRCRRYGSDAFETRLMLRKVVCTTGAEAARMFYEPGRFTRRGALPPTTLRLLQDVGSVAVLDAEAHRHRKRMFMSLMAPEQLERLVEAFTAAWRTRSTQWRARERVVLHEEMRAVLCRAVCAWAGIPLPEAEAGRRTRELGAMIDGAASAGPRAWRGLLLRTRTERWMRRIVEQVRSGTLAPADGSALHVVAWHRDLDGRLLEADVAAVELLNLLRPTVAVARFVTFAALALHEHPACRPKLEAGDDAYLEAFVHEVRRYYPFFPVVGGRVREAFDWHGRHFAEGTWVLLDLYGTDRDERTWGDPAAFRPERFLDRDQGAFDFIPQGGGDHYVNHRCAGEWATIALLKEAVHLLTTSMHYDVPEQDLRVSLSRMPSLPRSGFVIAAVHEA